MLRKNYLPKMLLGFVLIISLMIAACSPQLPDSPDAPDSQPPPADDPPAVQEAQAAVYYVKMTDTDTYLVREVHTVTVAERIEIATLEQIIHGEPVTEGAYRVLPPDTRVLGIAVMDGLATIDFSREVLNANVGAAGEALGIQSIVNTLTELPEIEQVMFLVEGDLDERAQDWWGHIGLAELQPFERDLSMVWEPAIWVNEPQPGIEVSSPLTVQGSARVYEATVNLRLVDRDEAVLVDTFTTATAGGPARGEFETVLEFPAPSTGEGRLEVFWISPKDGSEQDKVRIPIKFNL